MNRDAVLLAVAVGLAVPLAGCLGGAPSEESPDDEFNVEGTEWALEPADLTVPAGENVTVVYENAGDAAHNWAVDLDGDGEPDHRTDTIQPGETANLTFAVDEPGEYAVFCNVSGHRDAGMEGTLTVEG